MKKQVTFFTVLICFCAIIISIFFTIFFKSKINMNNFSKSALDNKLRQDLIKKNIWSNKCPVPLERLNLLRLSYFDFDGNEHHNGQIIVHDVVADHVIEIFKTLYQHKFAISSIRLINDYSNNFGVSDEKSMEDNNTSAFNCRTISNSKIQSIHSYGMAIDINPQQNPYLLTKFEQGKVSVPVFPPQGMEYLNRSNIRTGMVESIINDQKHLSVIDVFYNNGFKIWGGKWNEPIDWHHFQLTREQAEIIASLPYEQGVKYFKANVIDTN